MKEESHWLLTTKNVSLTLRALNEKLAIVGISLSRDEVQALIEARAENLMNVERIEFGTPAVVAIAEAIATSPHVSQDNVSNTLAYLQEAFYSLRDELSVDVPDEEITEALRGCFDEWGDAAEIASLATEQIMSFSNEYTNALNSNKETEYRIVDDTGHAYTFDLETWNYAETSSGWNGESWFDDWDN